MKNGMLIRGKVGVDNKDAANAVANGAKMALKTLGLSGMEQIRCFVRNNTCYLICVIDFDDDDLVENIMKLDVGKLKVKLTKELKKGSSKYSGGINLIDFSIRCKMEF